MCDFAVLAAAHAVEHYEIGRYQSLVAYARALGMDDAVALLEESLAEETRTEEMLRDGVETRAEEDAAGEDDEEEPSDEGEAGAKAPRKSLARARQGGRKAA
jgi:ferritin-like metal-binding protein YciE